jgi:hypothetical protein
VKDNSESNFYDPERAAHKRSNDHKNPNLDAFHHELHLHHHLHSKNYHKKWHKKAGHNHSASPPPAGVEESQAPKRDTTNLPSVQIDHHELPKPTVAPELMRGHGAPATTSLVEASGSLKSAIERAKSGGKQLVIAQVGDSHIAAGIETPALANEIARDAGLDPSQVSASHYGHPWKTAEYADQHKQEFLSHIRPDSDLVVVSFGSNDSAGNMIANYQEKYKDLLQSIHLRAPHAHIVAASPFDGNVWNTNTHLPQIDNVMQAQRNAAAEVPNTSFINLKDQFGSVASMQKHGLMVSDRLHLTAGGYKAVGAGLGDDIIKQQS